MTMRSKFKIRAQGRPQWTRRTRWPSFAAWIWIQRQTGSLRRPAEMMSSGQGGSSGLDLRRTIPARVSGTVKLVSSSVGR